MKNLRNRMGYFGGSKKEPLLYSPLDTQNGHCVEIDFFCLLSVEQWKFNESSKVYIRFAANELGTFCSCHGPMKVYATRYSTYTCAYL